MKASVIGLSVYKRNGQAEVRADVRLHDEAKNVVALYHSPRATNVEVTKDFAAAVNLTPETAGKSNLNGPVVDVIAEHSDDYGVRYRLSSYQADTDVLDDIFASIG